MPRKRGSGGRGSALAVVAEEQEFEIHKILDYEKRRGVDYYLIEWKGYPREEATWEPRHNINDPLPTFQRRMAQLKEQATQKKERTRSSISVSPPKKRPGREAGTGKRAASSTAPSRRQGAAATPSPHRLSTSSVSTVEDPHLPPQQIPKRPRVSSPGDRTPPPPRHSEHKADSSARRGSGSRGGGGAAGMAQQQQQAVPLAPQSVRVRSMKQDEVYGLMGIVAFEQGEQKIPINQLRKAYPEQLIDFLLQRIQFRASTSATSNPANATPLPSSDSTVPRK